MKPQFSQKILSWYDVRGRVFPWRNTKDPYKIWVSEIIFQQTRIAQGISYYQAFISRFPNVYSLDEASENDVLLIWQGLGYYRRALNMKAASRLIVTDYKGEFPSKFKDLIKLPGVGAYTAAAISSICFGEPNAVVDGNVIRLLSRLFGMYDRYTSSSGKKVFQEKAQTLIDPNRPGDYNQAVMDLGATICTPAKPLCKECFLSTNCKAYQKDLQHELPVKKISKPKNDRYFHYLYLEKDSACLLHKRKDEDIWKGLYQLPMYEGSSRVHKKTLVRYFQNIGLSIDLISISNIFHNQEQVLTHQVIHSSFYMVKKWKMKKKCTNFELVNNEKIEILPMPKTINWFFSNKVLLLKKKLNHGKQSNTHRALRKRP